MHEPYKVLPKDGQFCIKRIADKKRVPWYKLDALHMCKLQGWVKLCQA